MSQSYKTQAEAEAALLKQQNEFKWPFCPLTDAECHRECVCLQDGMVYQGINARDRHTGQTTEQWLFVERQCTNAMFLGSD